MKHSITPFADQHRKLDARRIQSINLPAFCREMTISKAFGGSAEKLWSESPPKLVAGNEAEWCCRLSRLLFRHMARAASWLNLALFVTGTGFAEYFKHESGSRFAVCERRTFVTMVLPNVSEIYAGLCCN
ncbi:MAG: hypothetical protein JNK38_17830 [Acidobacteria bacterium]|nr:hypothetical protein [Acidobacteriota bacterium]